MKAESEYFSYSGIHSYSTRNKKQSVYDKM